MSALHDCDPGSSALLVIDMQNDYCHPDGICCRGGQNLLDPNGVQERISGLLFAAREAGVSVIYCEMLVRAAAALTGPFWEKRIKRGMQDICREATWGQQTLDTLTPVSGDAVVSKPRYSGFVGTDLDFVLRNHGIESCFFTGVTTNGCVDLTLRDAYQRDYRVFGIADAVDAYDPRLHKAALENWKRAYGEVVTSTEVLGHWRY